MKREYRGFTLEAEREESLGGDELLYFTVYYKDREWVSSFEDSCDSEESKISNLREWVDNFIKKLEENKCPFCEEELFKTIENETVCDNCNEYFVFE